MSCREALTRAVSALLAAAVVVSAGFPATAAIAQPDDIAVTVPPGTQRAAVETTAGVAISLESSRPAVPAGKPFSYSVRVKLTKPADSVRIRLRVLRPTGRLIYQRTRTLFDDALEDPQVTFSRETADIGMPADVYPVEIETVVSRGATSRAVTVSTGLVVYDSTAARVGVVTVARIAGAPLADARGRFAFDPGRYTGPRDEVVALCDWVLATPQAKLTLSVPPVLLEEWRRISQGYELVGPEGTEKIDASSAVSRSYGAALDKLAEALSTGRMELCAQGFADPDLSELDRHGMTTDAAAQYRRGFSATYAAVETTPSTGTVPAGAAMPEAAMELLGGQDVSYVVVSARHARRNDAAAAPGVYRDGSNRVTLVVDEAASRAVAKTRPDLALRPALQRNTTGSRSPIVISAELGPGRAGAQAVIAAARYLYALPWTTPRLGREAAARASRRSLRLMPGSHAGDEPSDYWDRVRDARDRSRAIASALGAESPEALDALDTSLLAQGSAWAGADREWALAERGKSFADHAVATCDDILGAVKLKLQPVTLSGSAGHVPVTVVNSSRRTLRLSISTRTSGGISANSRGLRLVEVRPKESFFEVPVDLHNAIDGKLAVKIEAGPVVVDTAQVTVSASYMDRIVTIAAVVLLLGILLAFIIRRVRSRVGEDAASRDERYTEES